VPGRLPLHLRLMLRPLLSFKFTPPLLPIDLTKFKCYKRTLTLLRYGLPPHPPQALSLQRFSKQSSVKINKHKDFTSKLKNLQPQAILRGGGFLCSSELMTALSIHPSLSLLNKFNHNSPKRIDRSAFGLISVQYRKCLFHRCTLMHYRH